MIGTPEYQLAKFLDSLIKPYIPQTYMLQSTNQFLDQRFWSRNYAKTNSEWQQPRKNIRISENTQAWQSFKTRCIDDRHTRISIS